jgi:polyphosphate kinase 2 (PPK2 family)
MRALPETGYVGVFDRSHYEDVLIARVRELAQPDELERRYDAINAFEADLVAKGTTIVKCMLHLSAGEQKARLLARLDDPTKHWKYNPGDIDERQHWASYQEAYEVALERTNTEVAPWFVIPADKKWYRNLAIGHLLLDALERMKPEWPKADFDVETEKQRLVDEEPFT